MAAKLFSVKQESDGNHLSMPIRAVSPSHTVIVSPFSSNSTNMHPPSARVLRGRSTPDPGGAREQAIRQSKGIALGHIQANLKNRDSTRTISSRPISSTRQLIYIYIDYAQDFQLWYLQQLIGNAASLRKMLKKTHTMHNYPLTETIS